MRRLIAACVVLSGYVAIVLAQPGALGPAGRQYYYQNGPAVRLYDGGTGAHDKFTARQNLDVPSTNASDVITASWIMNGSLITPYTLATDSSWYFMAHGDTTKRLKFELDSIGTGTTRFALWPNWSGWVAITHNSVVGATGCDAACINGNQTWTGENIFTNGAGSSGIFVGPSGIANFAVDGSEAQDLAMPMLLPGPASGAGHSGSWHLLAVDDASHQVLPTSQGFVLPLTHILDNRLVLKNGADSTKNAQFNLSQITTATTRTDTIPDWSGTLLSVAGPGTSGKVLKSQGPGFAPIWGTDSTGVTALLAGNNDWTSTNRFRDNSFTIVDNSDTTKHLMVTVDTLSAGATRTLTALDMDGSAPVIVAKKDSTFSTNVVFTVLKAQNAHTGMYRVSIVLYNGGVANIAATLQTADGGSARDFYFSNATTGWVANPSAADNTIVSSDIITYLRYPQDILVSTATDASCTMWSKVEYLGR